MRGDVVRHPRGPLFGVKTSPVGQACGASSFRAPPLSRAVAFILWLSVSATYGLRGRGRAPSTCHRSLLRGLEHRHVSGDAHLPVILKSRVWGMPP